MQVFGYMVLTNVTSLEWFGTIRTQTQVIGRGLDAHILIPNEFPFTSRRHALIRGDAQGIWLSDTGSKAGTQVNGVWLQPNCEFQISLGDHLWLGGAELDIVHSIEETDDVLDDVGPG